MNWHTVRLGTIARVHLHASVDVEEGLYPTGRGSSRWAPKRRPSRRLRARPHALKLVETLLRRWRYKF